ncbi:hypothetical protein PPL_03894 [Heterostelium album PN500]|uniref:Uncharacterized protein n=1 Tax=Heterostelium pallidum (strain ATCC 26659 / Pp 5 / PN500) TaxID=670386 RepID=D3B5F6_HETP5|nr:hypothetical protein PPL_03894 [Heterostelium album PN500]EFA83104.1 hypothetical protein PPL_03894 [Heterostelium album PN500]|eukprot:XP_020435221.1 hypothetical protein PPL_03894 [Heterostelium album PN500]
MNNKTLLVVLVVLMISMICMVAHANEDALTCQQTCNNIHNDVACRSNLNCYWLSTGRCFCRFV